MKKTIRILLVCFICLIALGLLYVGYVFAIASGFIFAGDIDLSGEALETAKKKATLGSFFGAVLMLTAIATIFLSGAISRFMIKIFENFFTK